MARSKRNNSVRDRATMKIKEYVVMTVECPRCKTKQKVHVAARNGAQSDGERIPCLNCDHSFKIAVSDRIVAGPFPV